MHFRSNLTLSLILVLFSSVTSYAQDNKIIEVTVTDTLNLKPQEFIYEISSGEQFNFTSIAMNRGNTETVKSSTPGEIRKFLLKNNFKFGENLKNGYTINRNSGIDTVFLVTL